MVDTPSPPQYVTPPPDPLYTQLQQQALTDQVNATQTQARGDTASLMARYGALASVTSMTNPSAMPVGMAMNLMAGSTGSPALGQIARAAFGAGAV